MLMLLFYVLFVQKIDTFPKFDSSNFSCIMNSSISVYENIVIMVSKCYECENYEVFLFALTITNLENGHNFMIFGAL